MRGLLVTKRFELERIRDPARVEVDSSPKSISKSGEGESKVGWKRKKKPRRAAADKVRCEAEGEAWQRKVRRCAAQVGRRWVSLVAESSHLITFLEMSCWILACNRNTNLRTESLRCNIIACCFSFRFTYSPSSMFSRLSFATRCSAWTPRTSQTATAFANSLGAQRWRAYQAFDANLDKEALTEARAWFAKFDESQLPKGSTTYTRAQGPGGQHVNK